uniref:Uncharacterized protein n=1 Tax=Prymnesium polylepis TaxID=72548 RepID=A0A7S4IGA4_9EUKA
MALIAIAFFGLDQVGAELENPFGTDANDFPLLHMGISLVDDLDSMMHSAQHYAVRDAVRDAARDAAQDAVRCGREGGALCGVEGRTCPVRTAAAARAEPTPKSTFEA